MDFTGAKGESGVFEGGDAAVVFADVERLQKVRHGLSISSNCRRAMARYRLVYDPSNCRVKRRREGKMKLHRWRTKKISTFLQNPSAATGNPGSICTKGRFGTIPAFANSA